jgi:hypothetical protein
MLAILVAFTTACANFGWGGKYREFAPLPAGVKCVVKNDKASLVGVIETAVTPFGILRREEVSQPAPNSMTVFFVGDGSWNGTYISVSVLESLGRIGIKDHRNEVETDFLQRVKQRIETQIAQSCGGVMLQWVRVTTTDFS